MAEQRHVRDVQALGRFEIFFVVAVTTVIVVRAFLVVTGYPKVGGGSLHVAHVLYGGLAMAVAIAMLEIAPGTRTKRRAAVVGGIGFGLFIDEVGKFVTKDVNYFFKPAIAIIYTIFVTFFLIVREVILRRALSEQKCLAVASTALADLALGQLHADDRRHAIGLLDGVAGHRDFRAAVRRGLHAERPCGEGVTEVRITAWRDRLGEMTRRLVDHERFNILLAGLMVVGIAGILTELGLIVFLPQTGRSRGGQLHAIDVAAIASAALSAPYTAFGLFRLIRGNQAGALRVLFRATLVSVLFTQVFVFFRYQLTGVIGVAYALLILSGLRILAESASEVYRSPVPAPADH
ncbi:MAG: hypothetical protein M3063_08215 [Actinomycetota bacterium]|nr:hypothetical protein [Actinomycetota bacterium]